MEVERTASPTASELSREDERDGGDDRGGESTDSC